MDNKTILATLKARLFQEHGTNEVKLKKNVQTGTQDWRAGGGDPYCGEVRAKSATEFEWYLHDWAYGWYGEDDYCNGVSTNSGHLSDELKIKILCQALGVSKKSVEEKRENTLSYEDAKDFYRLLREERDERKWELARRDEMIPEDEEFLNSEGMYKLWAMRKSDKAMSYKEMYAVVQELLELIDHAESEARYAGYSGM